MTVGRSTKQKKKQRHVKQDRSNIMGMTEKKIMEALVAGKKIADNTMVKGNYVYFADCGGLVDVYGNASYFDDIVPHEAYIYEEPKQKVKKWLWVIRYPNERDHFVTSTLWTEGDAIERYGGSLICRYGEPIEVEVD